MQIMNIYIGSKFADFVKRINGTCDSSSLKNDKHTSNSPARMRDFYFVVSACLIIIRHIMLLSDC